MNSSYFYNNIPMFPHTQLIPKNYPYSFYNHLYAYQDCPKSNSDSKPQDHSDLTYKHQITKWLFTLKQDELFSIFTIRHLQTVQILVRMFAYDQWNEPSTYARKPNVKLEFESIDQIFLIRKQQSEQLDTYRATSQILQQLRVVGGENLFGIVCFEQNALLNLEFLLQLMHIASDGNFLSCQPRVIVNRNFVDDLLWFNPQSFQTLGCWLVNELEKSIALNFKRRKIQPLEINCYELDKFWKSCDKGNLISQAYLDYKEDKWYEFLLKNTKKHDESQFRQVCEKDDLIQSMTMTSFKDMSKQIN